MNEAMKKKNSKTINTETEKSQDLNRSWLKETSYLGPLRLALKLSPKGAASGCFPDLLSLSQRLARVGVGGWYSVIPSRLRTWSRSRILVDAVDILDRS